MLKGVKFKKTFFYNNYIRIMDIFFKDLFTIYNFDNKNWKIYGQNSLKFAIKYTNNTNKVREMKEIRSGLDGSIELKNGVPHLLEPNETRWIVIETSNKSFKFDNTHKYGAASYPKRDEDVKEHFISVKKRNMLDIYNKYLKKDIIIPFYQIAATYISLYPELSYDIKLLAKNMKKQFLAGDTTLGVKNLKIFKSKAKCIGLLVNDNKFIKLHSIFPMSYRQVPIQRKSLIIVDLEPSLKIKYGQVKYNLNNVEYKAQVIARIIDKSAVKGAIWKPLENINHNSIMKKLKIIKNILCNPLSYTI